MTHASFTLLLVDDNPGDLRLLEESLAGVPTCEFHTARAGTVDEACLLLRQHRYDAVLLDLNLPDASGLATLAAVQACAGGTPILVVTGTDDEQTALDALRGGAQDYLVKGQVFGTMLARAVRHAIERTRTEQSLREAEDRFRELANAVSSVFWVTSADGRRILFVNPAFEALTGLTRERAYADPAGCVTLVHPDDRPRLEARVAALPPSWDDEYRIVRVDGEVRWVRDRGYPVRSPQGEVTHLTGMVEDVTEARAAREKIRLQASLLEAVGESVIATDPGGTIFYWNRAAEQIYGWTAGEAVGRSVVDLLVPEMARAQGEELMERLGAGETWQGEFPVRRRDGTGFPALVTDAPIMDDQGQLIGIIGVSVDLTERKRAEQALRDSEARYRALFETMAQGVLVLGDEGRVLAANPAALEILGLDAEHLLHRSVRSLPLRVVDEEGRTVPMDRTPAAEARRTGVPVQRVVGVFNE
ncbi:MAG TPA: PAS domain S-box protein, partial [Longimicrobium sp.]|nr:PAS domain S-box protein [Longimicrobium sp.]